MVRSKAATGGQAAVGGARPAAGHQRPVAGRAALAAFLAAHAVAGPAALAQSPGPAAATAQEYLLAARAAVVGGRLATARDDLERAGTRLLDRPVGPLQAVTPDRDRAVLDIAVARRAVGAGQRQVAVRAIDDAIRQVSLPPVPVAAGGASVLPAAPFLFPPAATATPVDPPAPFETYAILPGRWKMSGATYHWVPPDRWPRRVEGRPVVQGRYEWRSGAWVWVPTHYGD